ncbi:unnamed protein product (macronuclear) [Paramecium tetraurelia]|uniref:Ubiquitin-like domain-containing protein n=1 Tax=Paramecium tetraurelia TaxID=5888 RepID=A0CAJ8_PARTE|nr:uncharacterized protein GSPATT00036595001 [Paramecium tetraurelia]CAK67815.1 unnamed protein product [Paramecium tetraurelia]|eukprot:XP_001435212.1 hypothetical protein (macronuclear) [Paramecium tetraurelia strain d4-2]
MICKKPQLYKKLKMCLKCFLEENSINKDDVISINDLNTQVGKLLKQLLTMKNLQTQLLETLNEIDLQYKSKMSKAISQNKQTYEQVDSIQNNLSGCSDMEVINLSNTQISCYLQLLDQKDSLRNKDKELRELLNLLNDLKKCLTESVEKILIESKKISKILELEENFDQSPDIQYPQKEKEKLHFQIDQALFKSEMKIQETTAIQPKGLSNKNILNPEITVDLEFPQSSRSFKACYNPNSLLLDLIDKIRISLGNEQGEIIVYSNGVLCQHECSFQEYQIQNGQTLKCYISQRRIV